MKVFYRVRQAQNGEIIPYNHNIYCALDGALQLGLICIPYFRVDEIIDNYERGDLVFDGLTQVQYCLDKFGIQPEHYNYPEVLKPYLGRKVWKDTIDSIASDENKWSAGNFVKPIKEKVFTGKTISSIKDLIGCGSCYENYEVLVSEPLDFVYECRGFVYYDELIDLRPYKGDYHYMRYMDTKLISKAMEDWKTWKERPNSCSLDFGVIRVKEIVESSFTPTYISPKYKNSKNNIYTDISIFNKEEYVYKTVLIESNGAYSLGGYGLTSIQYIKFISAYISQISGVEDELHF